MVSNGSAVTSATRFSARGSGSALASLGADKIVLADRGEFLGLSGLAFGYLLVSRFGFPSANSS